MQNNENESISINGIYIDEFNALLANLGQERVIATPLKKSVQVSHVMKGAKLIFPLIQNMQAEINALGTKQTDLSTYSDSDLLALMQSINEALADRYYHDDVFDVLEDAIIESRKTIEVYSSDKDEP